MAPELHAPSAAHALLTVQWVNFAGMGGGGTELSRIACTCLKK